MWHSGKVQVLHLSLIWPASMLCGGAERWEKEVHQRCPHYCLSVLCLHCALFTVLFTRATTSRAALSPELCLS